ncbi:MAG: RHS repeat-associated core domain-containing protein [Planctomycetota bacterium]|nr:MAG: RHS repeat-associated core domain-containing protein [Planctomycetota bacterium]
MHSKGSADRGRRGNRGNGVGPPSDFERYYTFDANQNITAVIDGANGNVLERYVYDPYGAVTVYDSAWANPTAPSDDGPLYAGYYFDAETGLYHVRNRYYDTSLGRFISRDPIGYGDGPNLYAYASHRPVFHLDPYGTQAEEANNFGVEWSDIGLWMIRQELLSNYDPETRTNAARLEVLHPVFNGQPRQDRELYPSGAVPRPSRDDVTFEPQGDQKVSDFEFGGDWHQYETLTVQELQMQNKNAYDTLAEKARPVGSNPTDFEIRRVTKYTWVPLRGVAEIQVERYIMKVKGRTQSGRAVDVVVPPQQDVKFTFVADVDNQGNPVRFRVKHKIQTLYQAKLRC